MPPQVTVPRALCIARIQSLFSRPLVAAMIAMRFPFTTLAAAVAIAVPAMAAAQQGGFRLQPEATPTLSRTQGPVASDVPESRRIRQDSAVPTPTPAPAPVVTSAPSPTAAAPDPVDASPAPGPAPSIAARPASPRVAASASATPQAVPAAGASAPAVTPSGAEALPGFSPLPAREAGAEPAAAQASGSNDWLAWLLGGAIAVILLAVPVWLVRRRAQATAEPPEIEKPRVTETPAPPAPEPAPAPVAHDSEPAAGLSLALDPLRLSLTLVNASLAYRLEVANRGSEPVTGLLVEADMISAHASLGRQEQLAGPGNGAPERHAIEHLAPGESRVIQGEFRLPFGQIVPIRQGQASLLLPLARFRASSPAAEPVIRTFAVGQASADPAAGLQPFRLDHGPRVYPRLTQRAFA